MSPAAEFITTTENQLTDYDVVARLEVVLHRPAHRRANWRTA